MHTRFLNVAAAAILLHGCGDALSPETQVRRSIASMETAAEARDIGDLMAFVMDDFRDGHGQGPREVRRYLQGYFIAHQSIHLLTRITDIEFPAPDEARVQMTVGMVGREGDAWDLAGDVYDFNLTLRRQGEEWKVIFAERRRPG